MNPEFVYFDLDDTLLNHRQAQQKALLDVHEHFAFFGDTETGRFIEIYNSINGKQWTLYNEGKIDADQLQHNRFDLTLRKLNLDEKNADKVGEQYLQFYQNHWRWIEGAEQAFDAIRAKYKVGILTNGFTEIQEKKFKQFDLYNRADELIISEQVGALKPHPAVFEHATKLSGYQPEEILYIGDSFQSDITGGHNYGWNTAWFMEVDGGEEQVIADFVFNDYGKLLNLLQIKD
jgi:putative hydrolase of the HAD superfamily